MEPNQQVKEKSNQFTVEEHNDLITNISSVIEELKPHKEKLAAREAIKLLTQSVTRVNELYTSGIVSDQNMEENKDE